MRNTDRGADNYMIKYCEGRHERPLVDIAPSRSSMAVMPTMMREVSNPDPRASSPSSPPKQPTPANESAPQYGPRGPHIHVSLLEHDLLLFTYAPSRLPQLITVLLSPMSIPKDGDPSLMVGYTCLLV